MKPAPGLMIEQQPEKVLVRLLAWGEARGEQERLDPQDRAGRIESVAMAAVIWVAINRAKRRRLTLRQAILEPWAFSCFNASDPNRDKLLRAHDVDPISYERADTVADLIESGFMLDPSNGADHYCTLTLWGREALNPERPKWFEKPLIESNRTREVARHDNHVFAVHR